MSRRSASLAFPLAFLFAACTPAPHPMSGMPRLFEGACEGESCITSFPALACADAALRATPSDSSPVVARITRGDTVEVLRTDLHVLRTGLVIVRDTFTLGPNETYSGGDSLRFQPGDTLHLLHYIELGAWRWWRNGQLEGGMEFWAGPADASGGGVTLSGDSSRAVGRAHPEVAWWWRVQARDGRAGWWRARESRALLSLPWMEQSMDTCESVE